MPPFAERQAVWPRGYYHPSTSLNIPVIGLVLAFSLLLLVCVGICCCSYRKTAKRNKRYQQPRERADGDLVNLTYSNRPMVDDSLDAPVAKAAKWAESSEPPAYSTLNHTMPESPQIPHLEVEHPLPASPITPRALTPPPPTYSRAR